MCEQFNKKLPIILGLICAICVIVLLVGVIICKIINIPIGEWAFWVFISGLLSGLIALLNCC